MNQGSNKHGAILTVVYQYNILAYQYWVFSKRMPSPKSHTGFSDDILILGPNYSYSMHAQMSSVFPHRRVGPKRAFHMRIIRIVDHADPNRSLILRHGHRGCCCYFCVQTLVCFVANCCLIDHMNDKSQVNNIDPVETNRYLFRAGTSSLRFSA